MCSVEMSLAMVEQQRRQQQQKHQKQGHQFDDAISSIGSCDDEDDNSSVSDTSSDAKKPAIFADEETKRIHLCRIGLILVLMLTGAAICAGTYLFVRDESTSDFKLSFTLFANAIETSWGHHLENLEHGVRNLGDTISASANVNEQTTTFPFVTVDKFEVHGGHARDRSKLEAIVFAPLLGSGDPQKEAWEGFAMQHQDWINASRTTYIERNNVVPEDYIPGKISPFVYHLSDGIIVESSKPEDDADVTTTLYAPVWYLSPPPFNASIVNFDLLSHAQYRPVIEHATRNKAPALSPVMNVKGFSSLQVTDAEHLWLYHQQYTNITETNTGYDQPHTVYIQPVFDTINNENVVGVLMGAIAWDVYLADLLPEGVNGVIFVLHCTCGTEDSTYTYELNGMTPTYLGEGDLHDRGFKDLVRNISLFSEIDNVDTGVCSYSARIYPSETLQQAYESDLAITATATVAGTLGIVVLIFFTYATLVDTRNKKVTAIAERSNAVISSLFPVAVRDRLMQVDSGEEKEAHRSDSIRGKSPAMSNNGAKPIAELFPETTIMFADIVGFTAWSSMREPCQVFELLETLFFEFDDIAKRRRVFKVETVGDCYVAAAGVPQARTDHAVVMTRFARDCVEAFQVLVKQLEVTLGPDTTDLGIRVGIHSGPVTAGVLRGERARFQLFGDSMNTAARIESNGEKNRIHCSEETSNLLIAGGKKHWITAREDKIHAKGKGELQTYWIETKRGGSSGSPSVTDSDNLSASVDQEKVVVSTLSDKNARLVEWNVEVLAALLKRVVARRAATGETAASKTTAPAKIRIGGTPSDEVVEIISLPEFNIGAQQNRSIVQLSENVVQQLRAFVSGIATTYNANEFHNFEHASHVTMSVTKLMSRIVAAPPVVDSGAPDGKQSIAAALHDHTYGITSDPLTQFACVFSALIHDVDHRGVPNSQLVKENKSVAAVYGTSPAEQNSIDLSWEFLMQDEFTELRNTLCATHDEFARFRQLVVNVVMATDIMDKDLKAQRNARWETAFNQNQKDKNPRDTVNRKATIVIEHLIQASDVAHTMQHWHIYRKWNERFFMECYSAYRSGRAPSDPSESWYKGEIGFFDFYIIPLAKKLKECGVFGVSSDEYLKYAEANRKEWEARGKEVVASMIEKAQSQWPELEGTAKVGATKEGTAKAGAAKEETANEGSKQKRRWSLGSSRRKLGANSTDKK